MVAPCPYLGLPELMYLLIPREVTSQPTWSKSQIGDRGRSLNTHQALLWSLFWVAAFVRLPSGLCCLWMDAREPPTQLRSHAVTTAPPTAGECGEGWGATVLGWGLGVW
jgi:hypothetical protein